MGQHSNNQLNERARRLHNETHIKHNRCIYVRKYYGDNSWPCVIGMAFENSLKFDIYSELTFGKAYRPKDDRGKFYLSVNCRNNGS